MSNEHAILFSVVIGTHNRADLLELALQTLSEQTLASDKFEVLVIDNCSTDTTREVTEHYMSGGNVRYVYEDKIGIGHARNRGMNEARGVYVVYTDDDCKLPSDWLSRAATIVETHQPDVFGGPFYPFYLSPKPDWFLDAYGGYTLGDEPRWLTVNERPLTGGNLFIEKNILKSVGGFNTNFGMVGKKIGYSQDTIVQFYLYKKYPTLRVYYDPQLSVLHLVRPEKMNVVWGWKANIKLGRAAYRFSLYRDPPAIIAHWRFQFRQIRELIGFGWGAFWHSLRGFFFRDRTEHVYWKSFLYNHISDNYIFKIGIVLERMKIGNRPLSDDIPDYLK